MPTPRRHSRTAYVRLATTATFRFAVPALSARMAAPALASCHGEIAVTSSSAPPPYAALIASAWQQYQAGNLAEAERLYRQVLAIEPNEVEAMYLLAAICQVQKRTDECMALYERCLQLRPDFAEVHNNLGVAHASEGRLHEALACYREALRLKPDYADALKNQGHVLAASGQQQEARAAYQQAGGLEPAPSRPQLALRGGDNIQPPSAAPASAAALNDQGVALMRQGRLEEAQAAWQQALRQEESPEVHNNLGYLQAARGKWEEAQASYRRALTLRPQYAECLCNLGIACFHLHRPQEAVRSFQAALALLPRYVEAHNNLGNAWLYLGQPEEAARCYRQAIALQPDYAEAHSNLAIACTHMLQWDEAVVCWQRSLVYQPGNARVYADLGSVYYQQSMHAEALRCFEQALALDPEDAQTSVLIESLRGESPLAQVPPAFVANFYDTLASGFDTEARYRYGSDSPALLQAALGSAPPGRSLDVLDLGCGTGLCGVQFRAWARTLKGVDVSPQMLARARQRGIYDELILSELTAAVQGTTAKHDLIVASDSLIYLGDLLPLTRAVHQALRPEGRFAFTVELLEGPGYRLLPTVHFAHSRPYLEEVASSMGMQTVAMNQMVFRSEQGRDVAGLVVVWAR